MPGKAEYFYQLRLEGDKALKEAKQFSKAVQKELQQIRTTANIVLQARVDTKATQKQALTEAQKVEAELKKGLSRAQRDFTAAAKRYGAEEYTAQFRAVWQEGTIKPSEQAIAQIRKAEGALTDVGKVAKKMGVTTDDLFNMSGLDRAVTSVQAVQRKIWGLRGLGYQLESYGHGMTIAATAMGATMAMTSQKYLEFAQPLGKAARNLDLNAELTEVLDRKLTDLAGTVSMMKPQEQAEGLYLWAAATGAVVDSEEELNDVLTQADHVQKLALLGNVDYGVAVEAVTDILSQYQMSMSETERVVATLVKVAAVSKAEVGDLAQAFSFAGARADQANTSFEDTAATLQLLSAFGLRGSRAGRGIGMLLENLIAPSAIAKKELDELFNTVYGRTDVFETAEGQFVGTAQAIGILADATEHLTEVERAEIVARLTSQNASRALVPLLELEREARKRGISAIETTSIMLRGAADDAEREQVRIFQSMMKAMTGYTADSSSAMETAQRQWKEYAEHVSGQAAFIEASFDASIVDIGREMTRVLLPVMQTAASLAKDLARYIGDHPGVASTMAWTTVGLGLTGLLTTAVGKGVRLIADAKTVLMSTGLMKAADKSMKAAVINMAAAETELKAATVEAAGDTAEVAGVGAAAGAASVGGVGAALAGLAGPLALIAVGVGALVAWRVASEAKDRADRRNAATMATSAGSYSEYIERIKDAKLEEDALTEATYDLIKAKQEEGGIMGELEAGDYAEDLADSRYELEKMLKTSHLLQQMRGITAEDTGSEEALQKLILTWTRTVQEPILKGADAYTLSLMTQADLLQAILSDMNLNAEVSKQVADEMSRAAQYYSLMQTGEGGMRPPEELAYDYMANPPTDEVDEYGEILDDVEATTEELGAVTARTGTALEIFTGTVSAADAALRSTRDALVSVIEGLGQIGGGALDYFQAKLGEVNDDLLVFRARAVDMGIEEGAKRGLQSIEELGKAVSSAADSGFGKFEDLLGILSQDEILSMYDDYLKELDATYTAAAMMDYRTGQLFIKQWEDTWDERIQVHKDAQAAITKAEEDAEKERQQALEDAARERERFVEQAKRGFEGLIGAALKPTSVTGLDMLQTSMDDYKDKWDENARRMRAAMEDPGGQWGFMIPEHIRAQGLDAAKAWGANWLDEFYAGMHPDQIQWPDFVQAFKNSLAREAAQKNLVNIAIEKLAEEGITATSSEVLAALGLQSPMQQMFLGGLTPEQASDSLSGTMGSVVSGVDVEQGAFDTAAATLKGSFDTSLTTKMGEINLPTLLNGLWVQQLNDTPDPIIAVGKAAGALFWTGFESSVEGSTLVDTIYDKVMTALAEALEKEGP